MTETVHRHDCLILGSGAAGLSLALRLPAACSVAVISKRELSEGSTVYAQGGISAVLDAKDSVQSHVQDTLRAGAGLCDPRVVRLVVERGPDNIQWLLDQGVAFTRDAEYASAGGYHLTREGGHSHRRIVHAADATGRAVSTTLVSQVRDRPNITAYEQHIAVDLITSRHLGESARASLCRRLCPGSRDRPGRDLPGPFRGARHRRGQQGLSLHQQPRRLHR